MKVTSLTLLIILMGAFAYGAEFAICTAAGNQQHPDVVFDGTEYTVVYDSVGDIWVAKVSTEGSVEDRSVIVNDPSNSDTCPSIAYDGTNFFIVWLKGTNIYGIIIDANNNVVVDPFLIPFTNAHRYPKIAFNGTYYLAVGCGIVLIPSGVAGEIWGITYNTDGTVYHSSFLIDNTSYTPGSSGSIGNPSVGSDNDKFIVVYPWRNHSPGASTGHALKYKGVTAAGQLLWNRTIKAVNDPNHTSHSIFYQYSSDVAFNGDNYFCSYHFSETPSNSNGYYDVFGVIIDPTDGSIDYNISIADQSDVREYASAVTAEDRCFFVVWQDDRSGITNYNLYGRHYDQFGNAKGSEITVCLMTNNQALPQVAFAGFNNLVVWQDYRSGSNWDIYGNLLPKWLTTDDGLALAYNGNRHLARKPNTNEFHLVLTDRGKVIYRFSRNEGLDWPTLFIVGEGKLPSIALDPNGLAYVAWTDNDGGLWFRYQTPFGWSATYHLYTPGINDPYLNSPPSIGLVVNRGVVYPHILVTRTGRIAGNGVAHLVEDFTFRVTNPGSGTFVLLEQRLAPADPPIRTFPSIVKDDSDTLHAVWQRGISDTIAYAKRYRLGNWDVWGAVLGNDEGCQSAHAFSETYGNKAYIAWQSNYPYGDEETYRADRTLGSSLWGISNMSVTSETKSIYSVNASGFFTVWADEYNSPWDIYYVVTPHDPFYNISQTSGVTSLYPHSVAKFVEMSALKYLYTAWLEGNSSPYEIRFRKITHSPFLEFAYLSTATGHNPASPYLIARDGYIDNWQVPIDYGYSTITYRFPLLPDFKYKLNAIAYHEGSGEWHEWIKIDGSVKHLAKYNPYQPKVIEFMIPPAFYQDSVIEVVFERIEGDFATAGPIEIYRYEYEDSTDGGGGPQDVGTIPLSKENLLLNIYPNPVRKEFTIAYALQQETMVNLSIYDVAGRLIDVLVNTVQKPGYYNRTLHTSNFAQGVYFLKLSTTSNTTVKKVIFLR
jgi:hypothetical protein